jgi:hypothetical protein
LLTPAWTTVPLADDAQRALSAVPAAPGVAQIVGPPRSTDEIHNLVIGKAADIRRWAASHLGLGKVPPKGVRPPVDLRPIATAIVFAPTASQFQQRLVYERLMSRHVPLEKRRDLKTPAYLRLDLVQRFPRLVVVTDPGGDATFGPFRDRSAAKRAQDALHKRIALRPCDFSFEPDPALPLGLSCLYAQVRTCAAPCLCRVSAGEYGTLAGEASRLLDDTARDAATGEWLPDWVGRVEGTRAVVVDGPPEALEIYPVTAGTVVEERGALTTREGLPAALAALDWADPPPAHRDLPWLSSWLHMPRRSGQYVRLRPGDHAQDSGQPAVIP